MDNHFIQQAFIIKNTADLRKKLEELGYKNLNSGNTTLDAHNFDGRGNHKHIDEGGAIITFEDGYYDVIYIIDDVTEKGRIDCGTNEDLFLALAALRDDTNNGQWFTDGFGFFFRWEPEDYYTNKLSYYKATVEELIEHFKEEEMDKFYIARNSDNSLYLYSKRPEKKDGVWHMAVGSIRWELSPYLYPHIICNDKDPKGISMEEMAALISSVSRSKKGEIRSEKVADTETGSVKNDFKDDKLRWDLLPMEEIEDIVRVYHAGAKKYGPNKWQDLDNGFERYRAACARHIMAYLKGEKMDKETNVHHLAAAAWNVITMLWYDKHGKGLIQNEKEK